MILLNKRGLSTQNGFALSTTTILFLKKKIRGQDKYLLKNKNVVAPGSTFAQHDQVRFGLFCCGFEPNSTPHVRSTHRSSTQASQCEF
jgi:hypothetical protein